MDEWIKLSRHYWFLCAATCGRTCSNRIWPFRATSPRYGVLKFQAQTPSTLHVCACFLVVIKSILKLRSLQQAWTKQAPRRRFTVLVLGEISWNIHETKVKQKRYCCKICKFTQSIRQFQVSFQPQRPNLLQFTLENSKSGDSRKNGLCVHTTQIFTSQQMNYVPTRPRTCQKFRLKAI